MRSVLVVTIVLLPLGLLSSAGAAQDLDWARQPRSHVQLAFRAIGTTHVGGIERTDVEGTTADLGEGVGGEIALGALLGEWLTMELRVGYERMGLPQMAERRDLWVGVAMRAWLSRRWTVSPLIGVAVLYHQLSFDASAVGLHAEAGLGWRVARHLSLVAGVGAAPYVGDRAPDLRLTAFVGLDVKL